MSSQAAEKSSVSVAELDGTNSPVEIGMVTNLLGGAWANSGVGPTLISKNIQYKLTINPVGLIPNPAPITSVNFSWGLSSYPAGLSVFLCRGTTTSCVNVTSLRSGSTTAWAGLSANSPFLFVFQVTGTGGMTAAYGQNDQVIVNYN
jgi:hypothetical protein